MSKLSHVIRNKIVDAAMDDRFSAQTEALTSAGHDLADAIYNHFVPETDQAKMRALEKYDCLYRAGSVFINAAGAKMKIEFRKARPIPRSADAHWGDAKLWALKAGHPLIDQLNAHHAAVADLEEERKKIRAVLNGTLKELTTFKQLYEAWPEGEPYYRDLRPAGTTTLPAILISDLNKLLGLPKAEPEALAA